MTAAEFHSLTQHYQDKEKLRQQDWESLIRLYPYAASLYVFRALAATEQDENYGEKLHQAAARILSRSQLQLMVEGAPELEPIWAESESRAEVFAGELTPIEIPVYESDRLHQEPEMVAAPSAAFGFSFVRVKATGKKQTMPVSASLLPDAPKSTGKKSRQQNLMDKFIHEEPILQPRLDFGTQKKLPDLAKKSGKLQEEIISESMAMIYIRQKKLDQAIATLHKLSLKFPEKSAYFASLIKNLENQKPT
jgi:hypothetical protein